MWSRQVIANSTVAIIVGVYTMNASWLAPEPSGVPSVLAHRGLYQKSRPSTVPDDNCSAKRINRPSHPYLENTIPSIQASFAAGATAVEMDVYPLRDGEFAVFHDAELDCRTNGKGPTREQSMDYLAQLDVGFGYTPDGGQSFPFRGKGVGMIKSLHEVLNAFPNNTLVIDIKSEEAVDAERLITYLKGHGHPIDQRLWVWVEGPARDRLRDLAPLAHVISTQQAKACAVQYFAAGWTGHVPQACHGASILVPINLRWAFWGWPNRFLHRMNKAGAYVHLTAPYGEQKPGLSKVSDLRAVPAGFPGVIITDRVDLIGPEMRRKWSKA